MYIDDIDCWEKDVFMINPSAHSIEANMILVVSTMRSLVTKFSNITRSPQLECSFHCRMDGII